MISQLFDFIEKIKNGLKKPDSEILISAQDMGSGEGLRFSFRWYDEAKLLHLNLFIPKLIVDTYQDEFLVDHIIHMANLELDKHELKQKEKQNDNTV
jgi:hypothetical protein